MPLQQTSGNVTADAYGGGVAAVPNYIEDVFSTWLYTGNSSTQTIANGIDLSTKGGMIWTKARSFAGYNWLVDTARGNTKYISSNSTGGNSTYTDAITSFNTTGFSLGADTGSGGDINFSGATYASWTFRKQPKFFDVVTYTGNGVAGRAISHSLGSVPGCIIVKETNGTSTWRVYHRSTGESNVLILSSTAAASAGNSWNYTAPTATEFYVSDSLAVNASGSTYVAYLFAHNAGGFGLTGTDNVISCGSFTTDGSSSATVNLGYEPQFVLTKATSTTGAWFLADSMRGNATYNGATVTQQILNPNTAAVESGNYGIGNPTSTGFIYQAGGASTTYIYIAIRRGPMKTPTSGTSVFYPSASPTNLSKITTGFPVDLSIWNYRAGYSLNSVVNDRLRGVSSTSTSSGPNLSTSSTAAEGSTQPAAGWDNTSITAITGGAAWWLFRRAPGFFDEVCYTGNGVTTRTDVVHNLGTKPEMIFIKRRNSTSDWAASALLGSSVVLNLNQNYANAPTTGDPASINGYTYCNSCTATTLYLDAGTSGVSTVNASGSTYVAYLFASCPGVSKVFSFTGNGTTQTINCGFTGGARFVLLKAASATGGWFVYDTARGMTTLTDPYLQLNSTAAETATLGSVTTVTTGFAVNESILTGVNTSGVNYVGIAIA